MKIINYATKDTPYEFVVKSYLEPSLQKFNLEYHLEFPEDMGSWQANTHYKAEFILKCIKEFNEAVVFIDSDATILQYPSLFADMESNGYDIGLHYLDWNLMWRKQKGDKLEALSGTLFINNTDKSIAFLERWIEKNKESKDWEQRNMQKVLEETKDLKIYELPFSYITIINHQKNIPEHMIKEEDVVILHHQKSREYKQRKTNGWKKFELFKTRPDILKKKI